MTARQLPIHCFCQLFAKPNELDRLFDSFRISTPHTVYYEMSPEVYTGIAKVHFVNTPVKQVLHSRQLRVFPFYHLPFPYFFLPGSSIRRYQFCQRPLRSPEALTDGVIAPGLPSAG